MFPFFSFLSFLRKGVLFHRDLLVPLVPAGVPVLVSLILSSFVPLLVSLLLSSFFPGVPVLVSLLSSSVPVLVSLLLFSFFPQERGSVPP